MTVDLRKPDEPSEPAPVTVDLRKPDEPSEPAPVTVDLRKPDELSEPAPVTVDLRKPDEPSEPAPVTVDLRKPDEPSEPAPVTVDLRKPDEPSEPAPGSSITENGNGFSAAAQSQPVQQYQQPYIPPEPERPMQPQYQPSYAPLHPGPQPFRQSAPQPESYTQPLPPPKNKTTPLLLAIIGVLIIAIGVIAGLIIMSLKKDNNRESVPAEPVSPVTEQVEVTETQTAEAQTEEATVQTPEEAVRSEAVGTVTIPAATEPVKSYTDVYKEKLNDILANHRDRNSDMFNMVYTLYDMNKDGTPELLVKTGTCEADFVIDVYSCRNGECITAGTGLPGGHTSFAFDYVADQIVLSGGHMGYFFMSWYDLDENGKVRHLIDTGAETTDYEKYSAKYHVAYYGWSSYSALSDTTLVCFKAGDNNYDEYPGKNMSLLDNYSQLRASAEAIMASPKPEPGYTFYDTTEAGSDFTFQGGMIMDNGFVNTEKDPLNLRKSPSQDSEIITKMPKGAKVDIYGIGSSWYYVGYTSGAETYYGYASRDYIAKGEAPDSSGVIPITKYGRINAHGATVPGYEASYIINDGSYATVRKSLGDGWHITAVNKYTEGTATWYELYDSDDNDYYGWVDSYFIDFYD